MQPDADLPLLSWRPTETPEKFRRAKGDPRDYAAEFRAFVEEYLRACEANPTATIRVSR